MNTFEEWIKEVDRELVRRCGLSHKDLPDCCYHDWYDDGATPSQAASDAIAEANES